MNFCDNCGKPLRQGVKFCPHCGVAILPPLEVVEEIAATTAPTKNAQSHFMPPEYLEEMTSAIDDALENRLAKEARPWASINPAAQQTPPSEPAFEPVPHSDSRYEELPTFTYGYGSTLEQEESSEEEQRPDWKETRTASTTATRTKAKGLGNFIEAGVQKGRELWEKAEDDCRKMPAEVRRTIMIALCCLAGVLIILLAATLLSGIFGNGAGSQSSQSQSDVQVPESQPAGPVVIPGPGEPSPLKTVLAEAVAPQYLEADQFQKNGLARVRTADGWEVIDKTGKFITEKGFEEIGYYNDGWCIVKLDGKFAFIDEQGQPMGGKYTWYRTVQPFSEGRALVETMSGKYVYLDVQGNAVLTPVLEAKSYGSYLGGLARVVGKDGRITYMDMEGNISSIAQVGFADGKTFDPETGLCPVTNDDIQGWFYLSNSEDNVGMSLSGYETASTFEQGSAIVTIRGKMCHIRSDGSFITPPDKYDQVWRFSNGYATVRIGDRYGYVDINGNEIIPVTLEDVWSFGDGLTPAKLTDKWGYLDAKNQIAIQAQWDECFKFYEGVAKFRQGGKFGFINTQGSVLAAPRYKAAGYVTQGMIPVCDDNNKWGYITVQ